MLEGPAPFRPGEFRDIQSAAAPRTEPEARPRDPTDSRAAAEGLPPMQPRPGSLVSDKQSDLKSPAGQWSALLKNKLALFPNRSLRIGYDAQGGGADSLQDLIEKMVIESPSPAATRQLAQEVRCLGQELILSLYRFGVSIVILRRDLALTEFTVRDMHVVLPDAHSADGREYHLVRGLYKQHMRLMLVGEEQLGQSAVSIAIHEFGHAWDHAYSTETQLQVDVSVQLWNRFQAGRRGFLDPYAATSPMEYFAVCFEGFYRPAARARLAELDPDMTSFLETLPVF